MDLSGSGDSTAVRGGLPFDTYFEEAFFTARTRATRPQSFHSPSPCVTSRCGMPQACWTPMSSCDRAEGGDRPSGAVPRWERVLGSIGRISVGELVTKRTRLLRGVAVGGCAASSRGEERAEGSKSRNSGGTLWRRVAPAAGRGRPTTGFSRSPTATRGPKKRAASSRAT